MKGVHTQKSCKISADRWCIECGIPYLLAYLGREPCAELAIAWITEIVAVILGYLCKAYFETKQAEQVRLQEKKMTEEAKG